MCLLNKTKLYIFGGWASGKSDSIEMMDFSKNQLEWKLLNVKLPEPLSYVGIVPVGINEALILGDSLNNKCFKLTSSKADNNVTKDKI
jgi:hypothetical protein